MKRCLAVGCRSHALPEGVMCFYHWRRVPKDLRKQISPGAKTPALVDAIRAIAEQERRPAPAAVEVV